MDKICLVPQVHGIGGMVSFRAKMIAGLQQRGIAVTHDLRDRAISAVLVIGGTRDLLGLWRVRRRGIPVVQRLDGMNWIHRKRRTGLRHFLRAEYGNQLLQLIRTRLAGRLVYQSRFAKSWWEQVYGKTRQPNWIVYNGVDLQCYTPDGPHQRPQGSWRILMVEGSMGGGYEMGLESGVALVRLLGENLPAHQVELQVVGYVPVNTQLKWQTINEIAINFAGTVPGEQIPFVDRSAHLLFSADINAACPNAVIEALACGLPVAAFNTGALGELVEDDAGRIVPYGGDVWQLQPPDIPQLAQAAAEILVEQEHFRRAARRLAEERFSLDRMIDDYMGALLG